jgi:hypothetical protein
MIYTILNIIILSINFLILIYAIKNFKDIVEESLTPKFLSLKEGVINYVNSAINVQMKEFEVKLYRDIAQLVQDQHNAQNNKK